MNFFHKHPFSMIVIGVLGISLSSIFVRYSEAPSAVTAAYRLLWTVILLTPVALGSTNTRKQFRQLSPKIALGGILSGLFLAVHFAVWFESLQHTSVASSTTIVCTEVIWVCLGYCLFLKGKLSFKSAAAIAVTLAGSICIAWSDSGSGSRFYGDMLALIAAIAVAVYTLLGRILRRTLSTTVYTYLVYCSCAAALVATCLLQGASLFAYGLTPVAVGFLLAVFSTLLGHSVFSWCLKFFSPAFVSASKLCEPVVAALLAVFLFGEIPTVIQLFGCVLILGGVLYYSHLEKQNEA